MSWPTQRRPSELRRCEESEEGDEGKESGAKDGAGVKIAQTSVFSVASPDVYKRPKSVPVARTIADADAAREDGFWATAISWCSVENGTIFRSLRAL